MIIDTNDDRRLEVIHIAGDRFFMCIENQHGSQETIILDEAQMKALQSYLAMPKEDM